MIFLFLVDTSCSMNQRTATGMSLLDAAKAAVEHFAKCRNRLLMHMQQQQQQQPYMQDRYLLVTSDDNIFTAVKSGWKDGYSHFLSSLKNLQAFDMTNLGSSIKRSLDLLNQFRLQSNVDNFGMGRYPFCIEPAAVILLTDGGPLTSFASGLMDSLSLPNPQSYNTELVEEPFRWDQRIYSVILQLPSIAQASDPSTAEQHAQNTAMSAQNHPLAPISEVTGGRCSIVSSMKQLLQHIEELVNAPLHFPAVVMNFEPVGGESSMQKGQSPSLPNTHSMGVAVTVRQMSGFWPIPEAYYYTHSMTKSTGFPARKAHPTIHVLMQEYELPGYIDLFQSIMDKYEIDPQCPMARYVLTTAQAHVAKLKSSSSGKGVMEVGNRVYRCFVANSHGKSTLGEPFGFIRCQPLGGTSSGNRNSQFAPMLYVLPYNFPRLFYLLDELWKQKLVPSNQWRQEFENYLQSVPFYVIQPLRIALINRLKLPSHIFPDRLDGQMPHDMSQKLKKLNKQAKMENERLATLERYHQQKRSQTATVSTETPTSSLSRALHGTSGDESPDFRTLLSGSNQGKIATFDSSAPSQTQSTAASVLDSVVSVSDAPISPNADQHTTPTNDGAIYKNPLDISRSRLLPQLVAMKMAMYGKGDNILEYGVQKSKDSQQQILKHSIPVAQMGNFDAVLRKKAVLRDPFSANDLTEWQQKRPHFGSPFQKRKNKRRGKKQVLSNFLAVDEAEENTTSESNIVEDASGATAGNETPPAPRSPTQAAEEAEEQRQLAKTSKSKQRPVPPSVKGGISPFDMPQPAGLVLDGPGQQRSSPVSPPQDLRRSKKRTYHAMDSGRRTETRSAGDKLPSMRKKHKSQRNVQQKPKEDTGIIREMANIPGILALPGRIVERIYNRQCHLRFSHQNAKLHHDMRKLIRQPHSVKNRQQAEVYFTDCLTQLSGTEQWKHHFIKGMVRYAQSFGKHHLTHAMEQYLATGGGGDGNNN